MNNERELYAVEQLPVFQNRMYDSEAEAMACPKGDVRLVENTNTGLIYNANFCPDLLVYDTHYQNEQAFSPLFRQHLYSVAKIIRRTMGKEHLVELGCGKGYFLELLLRKGFDITGFDPIYEGINPRIIRHYFGPGIGIKAKGVILRHVLEHIKNPVAFLQHLQEVNGGSGLVYIEVPCFDWICTHRAWFDVFYEHANYFRLLDFYRLFDDIVLSGHLFGGQYIYVVADLAKLRLPKFDSSCSVSFPDDFLFSLYDKEFRKNQMQVGTAVWGGASKGVIFTLLKSQLGEFIDVVIDINPAKQGKYLPATGLKVHSPKNGLAMLKKGSIIYVMNPNYLEEIKNMSNNNYNYVRVNHE